MTRHLIDHRAKQGTSRLRRFARLEHAMRAQVRHPKLGQLARRPQGTASASQLRQFLRIERGQFA